MVIMSYNQQKQAQKFASIQYRGDLQKVKPISTLHSQLT